MANKQNTLQEFVVVGQIEVSVPIEFPVLKGELKKIADKLGMDGEITVENVAKHLVLEAIRSGLDNMEYRQSEPSSVEEFYLEVE